VTDPPGEPPLLEARGLRKSFPVGGRRAGAWMGRSLELLAVDGVDLVVRPGETVGLVGESGCGKSTLGRLLVRLLTPSAGEVRLDGVDLATADAGTLRRARRRMQMVFQDNAAALDPRRTVGASVGEGLVAQGLVPDPAARGERVAEALTRVGLSPDHAARYPHELSGGQRQRVGIARALIVGPELVVADEPVSALDVSVQGQVVTLLARLRAAEGTAMVFISHDLEVVAQLADRVAVMYLGRIVEEGPTRELATRPRHPYTASLLAAIPARTPRRDRNRAVPPASDEPPNPLERPAGCPFHPRCPRAIPGVCDTEVPASTVQGPRRFTCHSPLP